MYGLAVSGGVLISLLLGEKTCKEKNLNLNFFWGASFWALIGGLLGGRLYHVIDYWNYYSNNLINIFAFWHGGMSIIGGLIGGILLAYVYVRTEKEDVLEWLDIAFRVVPAGQAIGRLGNVFNAELIPYAYVEIYISLLIFFILNVLALKKAKKGLITLLYLAIYATVRVSLNFLR